MLFAAAATSALQMPAIHCAPFASLRAKQPVQMAVIEELNESNFLETINGYNGLAVVEFYAPWCRTCRGVAPTFERMCHRLSSEPEYESVRFFKVNFKENKQLALRERVYALPAIHFYTASLGRINRFTLTPANVAKKLRAETDRYVGETGHLALLTSLNEEEANAISPLVRFNLLAGFLKALANAETYLEKVDNEDGAFLAKMMDGDQRRFKELEDIFAWIDRNDDGFIDADELAAVAAAVGSMSDGGSSDAMGESGIHDFYVTLLDHAQASIECAADPEACPDPEDLVAEAGRLPSPPAKRLDFASFARLMTSKAVSEYKTPEKELLPAFEALDANGDGVITREEMLQAMEVVGRNLPNLPRESFAQKAATAFDALDRDKSGELDYEEFVAVLSGMRSATPANELV